MTDRVWHKSVSAQVFHVHRPPERITVCGQFVGDVTAGMPGMGTFVSRDEAMAAGKRECRVCFGMAQTRQPIVRGRRAEVVTPWPSR